MKRDEWSNIKPSEFWDNEFTHPEIWKVSCISIHSHWLSEEECENHWMCYSAIPSKKSLEFKEFIDKETSFVRLFKKLKTNYGLSVWHSMKNFNDCHQEQDKIENICRKNVREVQFDLFKSDQLQIVIQGNFDLTFPVYQPKDIPWSEFSKLVESMGLYLLTN